MLDRPPTMELSHIIGLPGSDEILLEKPTDYIVIGSDINHVVAINNLLCTAENAENIMWEYKSSESENFTTKLPLLFNITSKESQVILSDDHQKYKWDRLRPSINGYYRCVATKGAFKTISPTLRMILICKYW